MTENSRTYRIRLTGLIAGGVALSMVGLAFASVPLYRLFCQVTGFGGTPQIADGTEVEIGDRVITVRFNADKSSNLPWYFKPVQKQLTMRVGEQKLAFYTARNDGNQTITGTATFNVTPVKAGSYFTKVDCFCFSEQTLNPGQEVDMPVAFYVDPEIASDRNMDDVKEITLSYTFFPVQMEAKAAIEEKSARINIETSGDKPRLVN